MAWTPVPDAAMQIILPALAFYTRGLIKQFPQTKTILSQAQLSK